MMRYIYVVMNIHIYGTFEKESQWRGASDRSGHIYKRRDIDLDWTQNRQPGSVQSVGGGIISGHPEIESH